MELWQGSITDFVKESEAHSLPGKMLQSFWNYHGYLPSSMETQSWDNSLPAFAAAIRDLPTKNIGVVLEYHLPYSGYRVDALLFGTNNTGNNLSAVVEFKQWSDATLSDEKSLNVLVNGIEHPHPSQQALDYAEHLSEIHSLFADNNIRAVACSFCHNLSKWRVTALEDPIFSDLLKTSPLFKNGDDNLLVQFLEHNVGYGNGLSLMNKFINGRFKPNKKLLDVLDSIINKEERWHLIGSQRVAYNAILSKVLQIKRGRRNKQYAVLVRGGPGTGKSVIAIQLLADANRLGFTAVHSTGGYAFRTSLQGGFKGADKLFVWNLHMRRAPTQGLDLLLVDEAHRIRKTSDTRWTKSSEKSRRSQVEELLAAAKVTVFLLDENQFVRPDEIGCSLLIREEARRLGVPLVEYDLDAQFRCGECTEYTKWIDNLLGFTDETEESKSWRENYEFIVIDTPEELDEVIEKAHNTQERARLVAGFCWQWSNPAPDGTLVHDVVIDGWSRPWNAKALTSKSYKPENHPYRLWAETPLGETQVGCIYSAQGFEFDRVGVIWGSDLVWRDGRWVAQRDHSFDKPVKAKTADTLRLVRNAYRVLLTRGIKETRVLCLDKRTKEHILTMVEGVE